ncbi:ATP-binding protein [Kribbella sp. NPDC005582]|uniref:ATP-binding protein n=1 Tax=Kribbella sp. NPDC005582 TaxID=3156893 RepID=UPI0033A39490
MTEYDAVLSSGSVADQPVIIAQGIDQARVYAALSGPFDPVQALRSIDQVETAGPSELTAIAAGLSQACDTALSAVHGQWLMRTAERRRILNALAADDRMQSAVAWRREKEQDQPTVDLLNAIEAAGIFAGDAIAAAVRDDADRETLERLAVGLGRVGELAPQYQQAPRVNAALTHLDLVASTNQDRGFFGRQAEIAQIVRWLDSAVTGRPASALYVDGLPGIGKSALLEEVTATLLGRDDEWVVVRFDFDRAGLDVLDSVGLTLEFARQVSAQLPGSEQRIQQSRERVASAPLLKGEGQERVPEELGAVLANALGSPTRRIFLTLDTLEVLRARGETHPVRLFSWLDQLARVLNVPIAIVGAGRGGALDATSPYVGEQIPLTGLDPGSADHLLARLDVDPGAWEDLRTIADGNPLALRLAAKFANEHGTRDLPKARGRGELAVPYLYRFILSRLDDEALKKLAVPGLVVRLINADVIREVVGPRVGLKGLSVARAQELFETLASQHWLVEPAVGGFVRHRTDMRSVLLPLLYDAEPRKSAGIDRAAAKWFKARPETWCAVESAYHELQLMRRRSAVPPIDPAVLAQLDPLTIAELPKAAQDVVLLSQGERSTSYRGEQAAPGRALDLNAVVELRAMNERSDWLEGNYVYDRAYVGASYDPTGPEAIPAITFLWRSGRWREARELLLQHGGWDRAGAGNPLAPEEGVAFADTLCRLEMGAEFSFDACVQALAADPEAGRNAMRVALESTVTGADGTLRFALYRSGIEFVRTVKRYDVVANVEGWWTHGVATTSFSGDSPGWERITGQTGPVEIGEADASVLAARSFAVLSPFADLVGTMSQLPDHQYLGEWFRSVAEGLDALGFLAPRGSQPWRSYGNPSQAMQVLTDLGLLAEAVAAAAYLHEDPDLRLVGMAAERWRRTTAGSWSYGSKTKPKTWARAVDVSIADRLAVLQADSAKFGSAKAQLEAWCPGFAADDVLGLLERRAPKMLAAATEAARDRHDVEGAAERLLRWSVPSAFVPPVAVLLQRRRYKI